MSLAPATALCFGYQNRSAACPTPHAIAYVSKCEQVACAYCVERDLGISRAFGMLTGTCRACGARMRSLKAMRAHWRPIAGAA